MLRQLTQTEALIYHMKNVYNNCFGTLIAKHLLCQKRVQESAHCMANQLYLKFGFQSPYAVGSDISEPRVNHTLNQRLYKETRNETIFAHQTFLLHTSRGRKWVKIRRWRNKLTRKRQEWSIIDAYTITIVTIITKTWMFHWYNLKILRFGQIEVFWFLICSKILRKSGLIMLQGSIVLFNYEETHTLKGLVGVDAQRGFLFVSQFNTCSILDRQIVHWIGLALVIYCSKHIFEEIQFPRCYHGRQGVWKRIRSKKLKLRLNIRPIQSSDA